MLDRVAHAAKYHAVEQICIPVVADVMQLQLITPATSFASILSSCERHGSDVLAKLSSHNSVAVSVGGAEVFGLSRLLVELHRVAGRTDSEYQLVL
jgi:hypothetical protein